MPYLLLYSRCEGAFVFGPLLLLLLLLLPPPPRRIFCFLWLVAHQRDTSFKKNNQ
jgi:hypothetical protein